jgi:hypothetical protein
MKSLQFITMGLLSFLFGCSDKPSEKQVDKTPIQQLEYAISDVGVWTWWTTDSSKSIQLEFDRTLLNVDNKDNTELPSHRIALRFLNPKSVTLLYRKESKLPKDWLELFEKDKIEPFSVDYENFSFDSSVIHKMISKADRSETIIGENYNGNSTKLCSLKLELL